MNSPGYWEREDGNAWASVESLPPPSNEASAPPSLTPAAFPWESLESLPPPLDTNSTSSELPRDSAPKEGWSFQNLEDEEEEEEKEEEQKEEWIDTPLSPTTPRAPTCHAVEDVDEEVCPQEITYIPLDLLRPPTGYPTRVAYPTHASARRPGPPAAGPHRGLRPSDGHGHNRHPPVIPLSTLHEQLGISAPIGGSRKGRQRPLSSLPPPTTKPKRSDFDIPDITYQVREEKLFAGGREVVFPKIPTYLPPTVQKTRSPPRGSWGYRERHTHTHTRKCGGGGYSSPPAIDPFWDEQDRLFPRDEHFNIIGRDKPRALPPSKNLGTVTREGEREGLVKKKKKKKKRSGERYYYDAGNGTGSGGGRKATVEGDVDDIGDGGDDGHLEHRYRHADDGGPEWTDEEDYTHHNTSRGRQPRRSFDGSEDDLYDYHDHSTSAQPFNVKRIRDKALKTLGNRSKKKDKGKAAATTPGPEGKDPQGIYDVSEPESEPKPKKPDPYAEFKKTTGRHPRHFHKSKKNPDEVFDRFVLDCRPLAEGEEEPTGKNRRRPMVDMVNLKTGERTRRNIRGYDKVPKMLRVAAGVESVGSGLTKRRKREMVAEGERGNGNERVEKTKRKKKSSKGKRKKRDGCAMM